MECSGTQKVFFSNGKMESCVDFEKMTLCLEYPKGENMTLKKDGYFTILLFYFPFYFF